jgi:hypothetical protein
MGSPVSPALKEVSEASAALVAVAESIAPKLEGGLTLDEAVAVWDEAAPALVKGGEGLSLSVIGAALAEDLEQTVEVAAVALAKSVGVIAGKPVAPVEKSDAVEIVEAVGSVALSVLNAAPGRSVPAAVLVALVVNRAKIKEAVEGRSAIGAQFAENPFGQGLAVVSSGLAFSKALRGALVALQAAG